MACSSDVVQTLWLTWGLFFTAGIFGGFVLPIALVNDSWPNESMKLYSSDFTYTQTDHWQLKSIGIKSRHEALPLVQIGSDIECEQATKKYNYTFVNDLPLGQIGKFSANVPIRARAGDSIHVKQYWESLLNGTLDSSLSVGYTYDFYKKTIPLNEESSFSFTFSEKGPGAVGFSSPSFVTLAITGKTGSLAGTVEVIQEYQKCHLTDVLQECKPGALKCEVAMPYHKKITLMLISDKKEEEFKPQYYDVIGEPDDFALAFRVAIAVFCYAAAFIPAGYLIVQALLELLSQKNTKIGIIGKQ